MKDVRLWFGVVLLSFTALGQTRAEGPFVHLDGKNGFRAGGGVPDDAVQLLKQTQAAGDAIKCFAFTPAGDWVFLCGNSGYYTSNLGLPACKRLDVLQKHDQDLNLKCVAFAPGGGWTVLWGQNGNWTEGKVPDAAFQKMQEVAHRGGALRSIAFGPKGAWVLLGDKFASWHGNIPSDLAQVLHDCAEKQRVVRCVAFSGADWTCLSDGGWWTSNPELPSSQAIAKAVQEDHSPRWLAVKPPGPYDFEKYPPVHYLDAIVAKSGISAATPGVGVLVIDHGKVLLEKCYGLANLKTRKPITPATTFELASCTKQFKGTAILRLVEQGKLSIHDNVRKYLPELPVYDKNNPIHILDLERHTSGLREYFDYPDVKGKDPRYQSNEDYLHAFAEQAKKFPPYFKAGTDARYTNTNYLLLALIVERVAHESYGTFLKREIFDPLGMKTATVYERPNCRPEQPALGYHKDKEKGTYEESWGAPPFRHETQLTVGDGALWASLKDLARWDEGWRLGKVLEPATVKQFLVPSTYGHGKTTDYAFGWGVSLSEGKIQTMSHNGGWGGFSTFVDRDVAAERTILILANVDSVNVDAILRLGHAIPSRARE